MKLRRIYSAFTLIELLTVIAIIGILAAVVVPVLNGFRKGDAMLAATRMMLDGVGHARQLAISQHTTVYMVFVPPNFWNTSAGTLNSTWFNNLTPEQKIAVTNLCDKQLTGFNFVTLRSIGDQPGQYTTNYLSSWQSLPEKAFIASGKFNFPAATPAMKIFDPNSGALLFNIYGFNTNAVPFPTADSPSLAGFPTVAFNYLGQLASGQDEYIPLAHGSVAPALSGGTKKPIFAAPSVQEQAPGNSTNSAYNLIHIDWLTGRARLEHQQVR